MGDPGLERCLWSITKAGAHPTGRKEPGASLCPSCDTAGANPIMVSVSWLQPSLCFAICMETFFVWTLLPAVGVPARWGPPAGGQMQCGVRT